MVVMADTNLILVAPTWPSTESFVIVLMKKQTEDDRQSSCWRKRFNESFRVSHGIVSRKLWLSEANEEGSREWP